MPLLDPLTPERLEHGRNGAGPGRDADGVPAMTRRRALSTAIARASGIPTRRCRPRPPPLPIVRGEGVYLYTEDGRRLLDGISSWWVNIHGHSHPALERGAGRAGAAARARDLCRLHAPAGRRARRAAAWRCCRRGPDARVLLRQRIDRRRSRGEAGRQYWGNRGRAARRIVHHAASRVSRRHGRRDVGQRGFDLHAAVRVDAVHGGSRARAVLLSLSARARTRDAAAIECLGDLETAARGARRHTVAARARRADAAGRRRHDRLAGRIPGGRPARCAIVTAC